jgi:Ca-activated chloride channel family protein
VNAGSPASAPDAQEASVDASTGAEPSDDPPASAAAGAGARAPVSESDQEVEQWLNRVPDDPGGLLREKLRRRYAQRRYGAHTETTRPATAGGRTR